MTQIKLCIILVISSCFVCAVALAQDPSSSSGAQRQAGAFIGNMLPNNVPGVDEITPLWGLRYSHPLAKFVYIEGGTVFGHSNGVDWKGAFASARMDVPLETMIGMAYLGFDYTNYSGEGQKTTNKGGGHVGGGLLSLIGGKTSARFDMKLNSQPGTSLYFSIGLVQEF